MLLTSGYAAIVIEVKCFWSMPAFALAAFAARSIADAISDLAAYKDGLTSVDAAHKFLGQVKEGSIVTDIQDATAHLNTLVLRSKGCGCSAFMASTSATQNSVTASVGSLCDMVTTSMKLIIDAMFDNATKLTLPDHWTAESVKQDASTFDWAAAWAELSALAPDDFFKAFGEYESVQKMPEVIANAASKPLATIDHDDLVTPGMFESFVKE